jgi:hypothetical protein
VATLAQTRQTPVRMRVALSIAARFRENGRPNSAVSPR